MTAKTKGYITDEDIELEEIYDFVVKNFDVDAKLNRYENRFGESNEVAIYFKHKGDERRLFCMIHKSREFSKNGEKNRVIFMDLDFWGHSVEIMSAIITFFGGHVNDNDCEEEGPYYIEANKKAKVQNVIRITMSELNRRLGGTVVIIDEDEA